MKKIMITCLLFWIVSCAGPAPDFSRISIGMTKIEVVNKLGKPDSFSASNDTERLTYGKWDDSDFDGRIGGGRYFVKLVKNRVTAFGKYGDPDGSARLSIADLPPPPPLPVIELPKPLINPTPTPAVIPFQKARVFDVRPGSTQSSIEVRERARFY